MQLHTPSRDLCSKLNLRGSASNLRGSASNLRGSASNLRGSASNLRGSASNLRGSASNLCGTSCSCSHWSRYEAARPEHTDHWSKIKVQIHIHDIVIIVS